MYSLPQPTHPTVHGISLNQIKDESIDTIESRAAGYLSINRKIYIATKVNGKVIFPTEKITIYIYSWFQFHVLRIFGFKAYIIFIWKKQFCRNLVNGSSLCQCTNHLGFSVKRLTSTSLQITELLKAAI